jgi:uncharacterized protein HemY
MTIIDIALIALIFAGVAAFVVLPSLYRAWARRRRRKHVAFDQRTGNLNLFGRRDAEKPADD